MSIGKRFVSAAFLVAGALAFELPVRAQSMPLARQSGSGPLEIWLLDEASGTTQVVMTGVAFLPVALSGYSQLEQLRLVLPTLQGIDGPAPHVRLPGGGSLYRITLNGGTALLHIHADGVPQVVLLVPNAGGQPSLLPRLFVTPDGSAALVATCLAAGGDVLRIDLVADSVNSLTDQLAPLVVDDVSLRKSSEAAWFVADGTLFRASGPLAPAESVDTSAWGPQVLGELALADEGQAVAAVLGSADDDRRIVVVPASGSSILVTETQGSYSTPEYDNPLGPFLVLAPEGDLIAYKGLVNGTQELFVKEVYLPQPELNITDAPDFPVYIDNVGVLGFFTGYRVLCFIAGDIKISGVSAQELLGAADMYKADFSTPGVVVYTNVTQTNGQFLPPFTQPATLAFAQVLRDPRGERFLLIGEDDEAAQTLAAFPTPWSYVSTSVTTLLSGADDQPVLRAIGDNVLVEVPTEGTQDEDDGLQLELLPPLSADPPQLVTLASLPDGITLDRWTSDHSGTYAACVASVAPGLEIPVHLLLAGGVLLPTIFLPFGVSPVIAFSSSDKLYLGLGAAGGPYKFAAFSAPLVGKAVAIPVGEGFPLQH